MNSTGLLGQLHVSQATNIDEHLLLLAIPFFILLIVWKNNNKLASLSVRSNTYVKAGLIIVSIGLSILTYFESIWQNDFRS